MSIISIILVLIIAFFAGLEGILDQFQFHQPIISCTLIGLVTGHLTAGIILGGTIQMMALGWANIGAAVAPDAALAGVAAAIIMVQSNNFDTTGITVAFSTAIPLSVAGLFLTMIVRTISVGLVHGADAEAKKGNFVGLERFHFVALLLQGIRIVIPAFALIMVPTQTVQNALEAMPAWLTDGMAIGGGMVVAVGYALVINMMASREVWPFFAIGFALAAVSSLTLISLGAIGVALALIYINLSKMGGNGNSTSGGNGSTDPIGDILNDY